MRILVLITGLLVFLSACRSGKQIAASPSTVTIDGFTFDRVTGKGLNGTFVINMTRGGGAVADSAGRFSLTACAGDSIRFHYVGMKDTVAVITAETSSPWMIGIDTATFILIDKGVRLRDSVTSE